MIRTQIQLEEQQYRHLRALGARTGKGLAEQVREAVGRYLLQQDGGGVPLEAVLGRYRPLAAEAVEPLKGHDQDYADTLR